MGRELVRIDAPWDTLSLTLNLHRLADDIILSSSAPALMRRTQDDPDDTYWEDGTGQCISFVLTIGLLDDGVTVVVWQWLGFNRFFPPGKIPQKVMRGTASVCHQALLVRSSD